MISTLNETSTRPTAKAVGSRMKIGGSHDFQIWWCVNFDASCYKKGKKIGQNLLPYDPIAVTCCVNFDAKKGKKFGQNRE